MIPWAAVTEWGQRLAVITGVVTPVYGGLAYLNLTPVTQSYVTEQIGEVKKDITAGRMDTLDTKRVVLGLARNDLVREQKALEGAVKVEPNPLSRGTFARRLETIKTEIDAIDRKVHRIDNRLEGMTNE